MIPVILGAIAAGSAIYGAAKSRSGSISASDAKLLKKEASKIFKASEEALHDERLKLNSLLEAYGNLKIKTYCGVITDFLREFEKIKSVDIKYPSDIDEWFNPHFGSEELDFLKANCQLIEHSIVGVGSGVAGGAALALGAYSGATMLGTASTGTAIGLLNGAAASNATLAWLGGGSIAAGGLGIAGGTIILGGLVAGPAIAIFGKIFDASAKAALNDALSAYTNAKRVAEQSEYNCKKMAAIQEVVTISQKILEFLSTRLDGCNSELASVISTSGVNYSDYNLRQQEVVFKCVKLVQIIKALIDEPILDSDGNLIISTIKKRNTFSKVAESEGCSLNYLDETALAAAVAPPPKPQRFLFIAKVGYKNEHGRSATKVFLMRRFLDETQAAHFAKEYFIDNYSHNDWDFDRVDVFPFSHSLADSATKVLTAPDFEE